MRALVWQWGRRGAGPRFAAALAEGLSSVGGSQAALSLSAQAEILALPAPPPCELPIATYDGVPALARRLLRAGGCLRELAERLPALRPDVAICAMPAPLDLLMAAALDRARIPIVVVVHDADRHPGDGFPLQMTLQRLLLRRADALVALSRPVATRLATQGLAGAGPGSRPLLRAAHPPLAFGAPPPLPDGHGGPRRLLLFGRLLPYKGLDLLAASWRLLGPAPGAVLRVVGRGPESAALAALRLLPGVSVENRWVPEAEVAEVLAWSDALVLSHTEASQSGVAAAAIAARRGVVATRVGGLAEQLHGVAGAVLCNPDPAALAAGLRRAIADPPLPAAPDARQAWSHTAADLLAQIERAGLVRPRARPLRSVRPPSARAARAFAAPAAEPHAQHYP